MSILGGGLLTLGLSCLAKTAATAGGLGLVDILGGGATAVVTSKALSDVASKGAVLKLATDATTKGVVSGVAADTLIRNTARTFVMEEGVIKTPLLATAVAKTAEEDCKDEIVSKIIRSITTASDIHDIICQDQAEPSICVDGPLSECYEDEDSCYTEEYADVVEQENGEENFTPEEKMNILLRSLVNAINQNR